MGAGRTTVNGLCASSVGLAYQDTAHRSKQMHGHQSKSAQRSESDIVYMSFSRSLDMEVADHSVLSFIADPPMTADRAVKAVLLGREPVNQTSWTEIFDPRLSIS